MLRRERLIVGTKWMLETVRQCEIEMERYFHPCGSPSCWYGHMGWCPALRAEGLMYQNHDFYLHGEWATPIEVSREFYNLDNGQHGYLFGGQQSGEKYYILKRLHAVLQQPGPYDEPEIANLDAEWAALQAMVRGGEGVRR